MFPWTKPGIPLLWLILFHPGIYPTISEAKGFNIPVVDWLLELNLQPHFEARSDFCELLQSFLQDPKRCQHLSVGKARSIGHFAHLCAQTVLDNYLSIPAPSKNERYSLFMFFFLYCWHLCKGDHIPPQDPLDGHKSFLCTPAFWYQRNRKMYPGKEQHGISLQERGTCIWRSSHSLVAVKSLLMRWTPTLG